MTRKQLNRAAHYLRDWAKASRDSNTLPPEHRWAEEDDHLRAEYDEMMLLAGELQALARDPSFVSVS
jgi:hypothetical protein